MDEFELRIRNDVYEAFVRSGAAPSPAETAASLGFPEQAVAAAYRRLHDAHALVLERGSTAIRMLNPFSVVPTPHRVLAGRRWWYGNCAWDALGIPAALHTDAEVASACADCDEPVRLAVRNGTLVEGGELLVHFLVPAQRWWDDIGFT
jgi:hypothetical protein